jgi:hypothetical protein
MVRDCWICDRPAENPQLLYRGAVICGQCQERLCKALGGPPGKSAAALRAFYHAIDKRLKKLDEKTE